MRTRDGKALGVVVGVFADGLLAGRLRVQGDYAPLRHKQEPEYGTAVYAIPRHAAVCRQQDSLILKVTLREVRSRWLMHFLRR